MNTQPEALRLAAQLEDPVNAKLHLAPYIAAELRRLHAVNQDLLGALHTILNISLVDNRHWSRTIEREAQHAIAKATGEN